MPISKSELSTLRPIAGGRSSAVDYNALYDHLKSISVDFFKEKPQAEECIFTKEEINDHLKQFTTRTQDDWYRPEEGRVFSKERQRGISMTLEEMYEDITYNKYPRYGRLIAVPLNSKSTSDKGKGKTAKKAEKAQADA